MENQPVAEPHPEAVKAATQVSTPPKGCMASKKLITIAALLGVGLLGALGYIVFDTIRDGNREEADYDKQPQTAQEEGEDDVSQPAESAAPGNASVAGSSCNNELSGRIFSLLDRWEAFRYYLIVDSRENYDINTTAGWEKSLDSNNILKDSVYVLNLTGKGELIKKVSLARAFEPLMREYIAGSEYGSEWSDESCLVSYSAIPDVDLSYSGIDFTKEAAFSAYYKCKSKVKDARGEHTAEKSLGGAFYAYNVETGGIRRINLE